MKGSKRNQRKRGYLPNRVTVSVLFWKGENVNRMVDDDDDGMVRNRIG